MYNNLGAGIPRSLCTSAASGQEPRWVHHTIGLSRRDAALLGYVQDRRLVLPPLVWWC